MMNTSRSSILRFLTAGLSLAFSSLSAQTTFTFESVTNNSKTISSSSQTWALSGYMINQFSGSALGAPAVGVASPGSSGYMDTVYNQARGLENLGGIKAPAGYTFRATSFNVWPSSNSGLQVYGSTGNGNDQLGTVGLSYRVIGKRNDLQVVSAVVTDTALSPPQSGTANGGYWHRIDLSATAFASTDIDAVEFVNVAQTGAAMNYLAVDNFIYSNLATITPPAAVTPAVAWTNTVTDANYGSPRAVGKTSGGDVIMVARVTGSGNSGNLRITRHAGGTGVVSWTRDINSGNSDDANEMIVDPNTGDAYIAARATPVGGSLDWFVYKINGADGTVGWTYTFNGTASSNDTPYDIARSSDGHIVVCGDTQSAPSSINYARVVKLNASTGAVIWTYTDSTNFTQFNAIATDALGNTYATGLNTFNTDGYTVKISSSGAQVWAQTFVGAGGLSDSFSHAVVDTAGDLVIGGSTGVGSGNNDVIVMKLAASTGTEVWRRVIGGTASQTDNINNLITDGSTFYLAGAIRNVTSNRAGMVARINSDGALAWTYTKDGTASNGTDRFQNVRLFNGAVYAAGNANNSTNDVMVSRINASSGAEQWSVNYDGPTANTDDTTGLKNVMTMLGDDAPAIGVEAFNVGTITPNAILVKYAAVATAPEIGVTESAANVADGGSLAFGTTTVGTPVTKTFTITNSGTGTLNLSGLSVPSGFTIAAGFGSATVAANGGTTTFQITMSAGATATPSGMLSFTNDDADENPYNFTVSGTVNPAPTNVTINVPAGVGFTLAGTPYTGSQTVPLVPGSYTLATTTPQTLGVGAQAVFSSWSDAGAISHSITVTGSPLSITGNFTTQYQLTTAANPGAGGSVTPASGTYYDSGSVQSVSATPNSGFAFSSWSGGVASASSAATTVTMDAAKSITASFVTAEIAVYDGTAPPAGERTDNTGTFSFGTVNVAASSTAQTFTVLNSGTANLTLGTVTLTGADSGQFSVTQPGSATLAPSASTTFTVTFNPTSTGAKSAVVNIASNDADENPFEINVSGTGVIFAVPELLYYRFNGSGTTVPNLASAPVGTNPAIIRGGLTQGGSGQEGGGLIGSGVSSTTDFLDTGWATSLSGSWTFSLYLNNIPSSATLFYFFGDNSAGSFRCFTNGVAGANNLIFRGPFTDVNVPGAAQVNTPTVTHFVYDSVQGEIRAYVNGVLTTTVAQNPITITGTGPFKVSGYAANVGNPVGGVIDEFRLYNRALTAQEVAGTWNKTLPIAPEIAVFDGTAPPANERVDNTGTFAFGNVLTASSSTAQTFTIQNPGGSPLTLGTVTLTGADAGQFSVTQPALTTLAPSASTTFSVTFSPTSTGAKSAVVNIASDDADENPFEINVSGTGAALPTVTNVSPASGTNLGGTSVMITGTAFTGATAVTFGGVAATSVVVTNDTTLTCTTPAGTVGPASVLVTNPYGTNLANTLYEYLLVPEITVTETGVGAVTDGGSFAFGFNNVGTTLTKTFTLENSGSANLTLGTVTLTGMDSGQFSLTQPGTATLAPSASTTFTVTFSPTSTGAKSAVVNIASNDADENPFEINVSGGGVGVPSLISMSPASGINTGGTAVTINGTGFTGAMGVTIAGTAVTSFTIVSDTVITAVTPAGSLGAASVLVTTAAGTNAANALYWYLPPGMATFNHTGSVQTFTVPSGVTKIHLDARGAQGAAAGMGPMEGTPGIGGLGGKAVGDMTVTPGQVLYLYVGGQANEGTGGFNGGGAGGPGAAAVGFSNVPDPLPAGGGGGASDVRTSTSVADRVLVAGGGGGGGKAGANASVSSAGVNGGNGGAMAGTNGVTSRSGGGGFGGSGATGGARGIGCPIEQVLGTVGATATTEVGGAGGSGTQCCSNAMPSGGGGGGGYVGGGGGGGGSAGTTSCTGNDKGGGGGGAAGSNYAAPSLTHASTSYSENTGHGQIVISYSADITPSLTSVSPNTGVTLGGTTVVLTGTNFMRTTAVTIAGTPVTSFVVDSPTQITAVTPAGMLGAASVVVTTPDASTAANTLYTYVPVSVSIAATTATAVEGGATGLYTFTRNTTLGAITVNFQLDTSSTATAGTDFTLTGAATFDNGTGAGTIVIPDTQLTATVTLTALTETPNGAEAAETARLNVITGSGYTLGTATDATVTITENSFLVTNTDDSGTGSLRQAVLNANSIAGDDTITFSDGTGGTVNFTDTTADIIALTSAELAINSSLTIAGPGADRLSISGGGVLRVFSVGAGNYAVTFSKLAIVDGASSGSFGGGIYNQSSGSVTVAQSTLSGNSANGGGGIYNQSTGSLTVTQSTLSGNSATFGGGIYNWSTGSVTLANSIVAGNSGDSNPDLFGSFDSTSSGNLIGNVAPASGLTNGVNSNQVGSSTTPINALLGPLQNNGGPTQTHMLLNGSPAINAGLAANLPADTYDLDGDSDMTEVLPVDQRGGVNLRVRGPAPDAGAVEAFAFEPTITAATTDEDVKTTSGLVITANTSDGGLTTHYQITSIYGGTLYQNDGSTVIAADSFITKAEGLAGLKFTPDANAHNTNTMGFGFTAQATTSPATADLTGAAVPVVITVNPVADTPSVTGTFTVTSTQSTDGLVLTRNAVDSTEVTHFKITNIQNGTLYKNDGTTVIAANSFITVAEGGAGLKFTPTMGFVGTTSITVQAAVDAMGTGLSPTTSAQINVGYPAPRITVLGPLLLNRSNGLYEHTVRITNAYVVPMTGFRLTNTNLLPNVQMWNRTHAYLPVIEDYNDLGANGYRDVLVQYHSTERDIDTWVPEYSTDNFTDPETPILPPDLSGLWHGLASRSTLPIFTPNPAVGARLEVNVSDAGMLSGKVTEGKTVKPFTAQISGYLNLGNAFGGLLENLIDQSNMVVPIPGGDTSALLAPYALTVIPGLTEEQNVYLAVIFIPEVNLMIGIMGGPEVIEAIDGLLGQIGGGGTRQGSIAELNDDPEEVNTLLNLPFSIFLGWRNIWGTPIQDFRPAASAVPVETYQPTAYLARHHFAMAPTELPDLGGIIPVNNAPQTSQPEGFSFGTLVPLNVAQKRGDYTAAGQLADGSTFTCSSFYGQYGQCLVHQSLYGDRGSLLGLLLIVPSDENTADNDLYGILTWLKPTPLATAKLSRNYHRGFSMLMTAQGGTYTPPAKGKIIMDLPATPRGVTNALMSLKGGGLPATFNQTMRAASLGATSLKNSLSPTSRNPNGMKTSINTATGLITGRMTVVPRRTATFQALLVPLVESMQPLPIVVPNVMQLPRLRPQNGFGYFLLPQVPLAPQTSRTSPILSGQVILTTPAVP
jgi:Concanavalin A-like lectin/glucanases superfamily/IPT/TIG domain/Abnormal spindle-like microcephaly-assoc'd, ASPM-SPD-2-Hydin